jgi:hypothetical protein
LGQKKEPRQVQKKVRARKSKAKRDEGGAQKRSKESSFEPSQPKASKKKENRATTKGSWKRSPKGLRIKRSRPQRDRKQEKGDQINQVAAPSRAGHAIKGKEMKEISFQRKPAFDKRRLVGTKKKSEAMNISVAIDLFHKKVVFPELFLLLGTITLLIYGTIYTASAKHKFPTMVRAIG